MAESQLRLCGRVTIGARISTSRPGCRRLLLPGGTAEQYRVAQLDDYGRLRRREFRWHPPVCVQLKARVSAPDLPGTWGFGWWNDPFSMSLGIRGTSRRLPTLPNAAWIFYASSDNYLALRDDHPAQGLLAATFSAPKVASVALALGMPAIPLLLWPPTARVLRCLGRRFVREDAALLDIDPCRWHVYDIEWCSDHVGIAVDGDERFVTTVVPRGPLGLVLWIDNQFAAFGSDGHLRFGTLANTEAWLDIAELRVQA